MQRISLKLAGLFLFALLTMVTFRFCAPAIEARLENKTRIALHQAGFTWANATADGTQVTLTGTAPTSALKARAGQVAHRLWGPSAVNNHITIADHPESFMLEAIFDGQNMSIDGHVADQQSIDLILQSAHETFGIDAVVSRFEFAEGQPSHWPTVTAGVIQQLHQFDRGKAEFSDQQVTITGVAASDALATKLHNTLNHYQDHQYRISLDIKARPQLPGCQEKLNLAFGSQQIKFDRNGSAVATSSFALLDQLAKITNDCPDDIIEIAGHTDNRGSPDYNEKLGQQRASNVLKHLTSRGADPSRLRAKGYGASQPITSNDHALGRASNRRIEFTIQNHQGS